MQSSFFSVRLSYFVYQTPTDRQRIRQGIVEGPVMGVQTRHETQFRKPEEQPGTGEMEALDLLKEVAALLLLAQERAREGKSEKRPGEGKWYTSKPRWGGGSGDEVGPASGDNGDDAQKKDDKTSGLRMRGRRLTAAEAYKRLSPGMGTWDSRTTYMALGKVDGSDIDDVNSLPPPLQGSAHRSPFHCLRGCFSPFPPRRQPYIGLPRLLHQPSRVHSTPPRQHLFH